MDENTRQILVELKSFFKNKKDMLNFAYLKSDFVRFIQPQSESTYLLCCVGPVLATYGKNYKERLISEWNKLNPEMNAGENNLRVIDKTKFPRGEWDEEKDDYQWKDETTGLPCRILRGSLGALCGYVGISTTHPLFEKTYTWESPFNDLEVHGGITFSDKIKGYEPDFWFFGFDCSHHCDLIPGLETRFPGEQGETYRTYGYVKWQVEELAKQLKNLE